ncbi:MAG: hypothetical protein MJ080_05345 [Clostridia bacterium]|nr:hypothetical protein [Clostridia bacterium]
MKFTYSAYSDLVGFLNKNGYAFKDYQNHSDFKKCVIFRHDIDYSIEKSLELAKLENKLNVKSTYFVLLTTDFYNVFSKKNIAMLKEIINLGHTIGLHFDEMNYPDIVGNESKIIKKIKYEADTLSGLLDYKIRCVSMHRPSRNILDANLEIPGLINSYSSVFFNDFKYLSDSRRNWREPVEEIIKSQKFDKLHILTHAFWYNDDELSMNETLNGFISSAKEERYNTLNNNFTNLKKIINKG